MKQPLLGVMVVAGLQTCALALWQAPPKLCVNCKFYKKDLLGGTQFGKCTLFPREKENDRFLVDGKGPTTKTTDYWYCSTVRNNGDKCGPEARYFEEKRSWF
jgi:hypothetical protein